MRHYLWPLMGVIFVSGCVTHAATSGRVVIQDKDTVVEVRFSDHDRAVIADYYQKAKKRKGLPPGLAKRGDNLSPGLAKREVLPPGLQHEPLPRELEAKLSPLPSSYIRVRVGQDIVLMDNKTRVVFDVIYSAAF